MIHPDTELRSCRGTVGMGLFATAHIPRGTITYVRDELDICIDPQLYERLRGETRRQVETYAYFDGQGSHILRWDAGKYLKHSCDANTLNSGWGLEIAIRNIAPGEELTGDYGLLKSPWELSCHCAAPNCRGRVTDADLERFADRWDELLKEALAHLPWVRQPLYALVEKQVQTELEQCYGTASSYRSVRHLRP